MLDYFFGSKARVKILKQFLLHPEEKYYLRQLSRDLKLQVNAVRRELQKMSDYGLILAAVGDSPGSSDKKYYQANSNFLLYPEIRSLLLKAQILSSQQFLKSLRQEGTVHFLALTGFFTGTPNSLTDLLAVVKMKKSKFLELIKKLEQDLGAPINFTLMDESEFCYRREIADIFLHGILAARPIVLANELGVNLPRRGEDDLINLI